MDFISSYGYVALFLSLVLGIVGLPIPDEVIMTYTGFLVSQHSLSFPLSLLAGFSGSVVGISTSYWLGRYFGLPLLLRFGRYVGIREEHVAKVESWYVRYGKWVLVIGYFVPGLRHVTAFSAGMSRMPIWVFVRYAYIGGLLWVLTFLTAGRILGEHWRDLIYLLHNEWIWIVGIVVLMIGAYIIYRTKKRNSAK